MAILSPSSDPPACDHSSTINGFRSFFQLVYGSSECPEGKLLTIETSVLVVSLFLLALFVHGGVRHRIHAPFLNTAMRGIYLLVTVGVTYIMGLMHNAKEAHELFPIWAYSLIYVYGGVDTMTAFDLSDNEHAIQYWVHTLPLFFWAGLLQMYADGKTELSLPLQVLYWMAVWNTGETLQAFYVASKSKGFPEAISPVVRYMREGRVDDVQVPSQDDANPAVITREYRYLVWADGPPEAHLRTQTSCCPSSSSCCCSPPRKDKDLTTTTTEDIWNSNSRLLRSKWPGADHLKDTCLSFALSRLLLTRFAGFTLDESSRQNTREFLETELLSKDPTDQCQLNRLFRILEVELEFVFGFFYTKLSVLSRESFINSLRRLWCVVCFLWFAFYSLNSSNLGKNLSIMLDGHGLEVGVVGKTCIFPLRVIKMGKRNN